MASALTHAGCITVRDTDGGLEYLLVRALKPPHDWVLPKGHIETGESAERAALRELGEEAGVEGEIVSAVGSTEFVAAGGPVHVIFFLTRFLRSVPAAEDRAVSWSAYADARARLPFHNTRALLRTAHELMRADGEGEGRDAT